jgi:release factor glutamine methyltransferase
MRLVTLPGVFRPISDSWLLAGVLRAQALPAGAALLDLCAGSGLLAVTAALRGAGDVTAVDVSRRAVATVRLNARLNGVRVRALRGELFAPVAGRRFDAIVANPPYVPGTRADLPTRGRARAWEGGRDGRAVLDRIIAGAPGHLRPGGWLLVVHSSVLGVGRTLATMEQAGLRPAVVARARGPLGPRMSARAAALEADRLLRPGQRDEELVVVRGRAAARDGTGRSRPRGTAAAGGRPRPAGDLGAPRRADPG